MLLYLISKTKNEVEEANLIAEGAQLYKEGLRVVPEDQFNLLLEDRFRSFDLEEKAIEELCKKIGNAIAEGRSSVYAATFLAQQLYKEGNYKGAVRVLKKQRDRSDEGIIAWVKEAELHAREGKFFDAERCIDSAKRREIYAENAEALWSLMYWNLVVAIVREDFGEARTAAKRLAESNFYSRRQLPRGYIWKESAWHVKPNERSFKEHAKIWSARVQDLRAAGQYGRMELSNAAGDTFYIIFNPKYFSRKDIRRGDYVNFVITINSYGLTAENIDSKPFVNTIDDIFVGE